MLHVDTERTRDLVPRPFGGRVPSCVGRFCPSWHFTPGQQCPRSLYCDPTSNPATHSPEGSQAAVTSVPPTLCVHAMCEPVYMLSMYA